MKDSPFLEKNKRKKILILSDDMRLHSGIGTMTREIVRQTCHRFNYVQLGAAINHPDSGKKIDISKDFEKETNYKNLSIILYPNNGYGDANILRKIILLENPDAVLIYTDPRYWTWLFQIEYELRRKLPLFYYNIWDNTPAPFYNKSYYRSCDLLMNISKQTHGIVKTVLEDNYIDLSSVQCNTDLEYANIISYIPHGINTNIYKPLTKNELENNNIYKKLKTQIDLKDTDYVFFVNNRNIRRKKLSDIIVAFNEFSKTVNFDNRYKLLLHTDISDQNGTDLEQVKKFLAPDANIYFSPKKLNEVELNILYNIAIATVNIANAEGFGLATAESLSAGTPIVVTVTGGLQDQCGFKGEDNEYLDINKYTSNFLTNAIGLYKNHGDWAFPIYPSSRQLAGSVPTPYIYEDIINNNDLTNQFKNISEIPIKQLKERGLHGRKYILDSNIGMSAREMGNRFIYSMDFALNYFKPRKQFEIVKI